MMSLTVIKRHVAKVGILTVLYAGYTVHTALHLKHVFCLTADAPYHQTTPFCLLAQLPERRKSCECVV
jgi:hypothetical protein